tara:strand:- start:110 stop:484 length:375 start_codon:yes stop_codon:yes gene_type:complete
MKNEKIVLKTCYFIGILLSIIQLINSLLFHITQAHILRFPFHIYYGHQGIPIQIISLLGIIFLSSHSKKKHLIKVLMIWTYFFINSIYLRMNDYQYYNFEILLMLFLIPSISLYFVLLETIKKK